MIHLPKNKRRDYPYEYIEKFIMESNELSNKQGILDQQSILCWNELIKHRRINEVNLAVAYQLLKGETLPMLDLDTLNLRRRSKITTKTTDSFQAPPWELCKYFIAGWSLFAPDYGNTILKALVVHREFMIALPYQHLNGRFARLLFLWMTLRNRLPPHYFHSIGRDAYHDLIHNNTYLSGSLRPTYLTPYITHGQ